MTILIWIVFGFFVGVVAKIVMPGRDPGGFIVTILLGIAGAVLGGFLGRALGLYREGTRWASSWRCWAPSSCSSSIGSSVEESVGPDRPDDRVAITEACRPREGRSGVREPVVVRATVRRARPYAPSVAVNHEGDGWPLRGL